MHFMAVGKKMERPSWFCNALIFKRRYIYSSYKECKELGNRRYTKCTYPVKNSSQKCKRLNLRAKPTPGAFKVAGGHLMLIVRNLFNENARRTTTDIDKFTR